MRFSNVGGCGADDRSTCVRGSLITLASDEENFHLHMNTGTAGVFENFPTFGMAAMASKAIDKGDVDSYQRWVLARPANYYNLVESLVRAPTSYLDLQYYSQFPLLLTDNSGQDHFCKFRLVPEAGQEKFYSSLLNEWQQRNLWEVKADADDQRPENYLQSELGERIAAGTEAKMLLQIMTKKKTGREPDIFFYPASDWRRPWRTLGVIELTEAGIAGFLFGNPGTLPHGLNLLDPVSSFHPNWINYARAEIYRRNAFVRSIRHQLERPKKTEEKLASSSSFLQTKYKVTVCTGDMWNAGTDAKVSIVVVGNKGSTREHKLDHKWVNDFERKSIDRYTFEDINVGVLEFVIIKMKKTKIDKMFGVLAAGDPDWYLERVIVEKGVQKQVFPHYQWIKYNCNPEMETPLILQSRWSRLPQNDTDNGITARMLQAQQKKALTVWSYNLPVGKNTEDVSQSLPGFLSVPELTYEALDGKYKWYGERYKEYLDLRTRLKSVALGSIVMSSIKAIFDPISDIEEFKEVTMEFTNETTPEDPWLDDWESDAEFGRQTLNGLNPVMIKRIKVIPDKFPVTDEDVGSLLSRGLSLQEEATAGNIYIVDFQILEGIPTGWKGGKKGEGAQLELAAAMALFYHHPSDDQLLPIAIQLGQTPGPDCLIWTPLDSREDWLLAKFWFRHADAQVAQVATHLASSHFLVEPFAVAMHRCLMPAHPVHRMLKENLKFIISIDTLGREVLTAPGGSADVSLTVGHGSDGLKELIAKFYKTFTYEDLNYPDDLRRRDMMELPGYHHRDDCLKLWDVIIEYVEGMVDTFYEDDGAVTGDWELQDWVNDVFTNGFGKMTGLKIPSLGFPPRLASKQELVMYLQKLIFTDTVRHTFANFYTFQ